YFARYHGHERALIGTNRERHLDEIRSRITLDVELDLAAIPRVMRRDPRRDFRDITPPDVSLVRPRMDRDARRAGGHAALDRGNDAWNRSAARIAQGRDLIHVYRERCRHVRDEI